MKPATINNSDFTESQLNIIYKEGLDLRRSLLTIVKRYTDEKVQIAARRAPIDTCKELGLRDLCRFVSRKIIKTDSFEDKIILADAYRAYLAYISYMQLQEKTLTKQQFRSAMQDIGTYYGKAGKNKNVFRYVQLADQETDEDWEL